MRPTLAALLAAILTSTLATQARAERQPPVDVVFKIHLEPQADGNGNPPLEQRRVNYRKRRDDVEAVRAIAEAHGARLSIHGNGEFWEFAKEEGDGERVRGWLRAGHHVGVHMHAVYRRGPHDWPELPAAQQTTERLRSLWQDHVTALLALVPELDLRAATPFDSDGPDFDHLMKAFGFSIMGGGRHEIALDWLGHPPFNPWRPGEKDLEEDLANRDYLIVFHTPQITEADPHGPDHVFQDQTPAHLKVEFLQVLMERERQERTGGVEKRWLFGFLTHDNKSPASTRAEIEAFMGWIDGFVAAGLARYATFDQVAADFVAWEARHPGVSSFHYQPGDPYPYAFPALAEALRATSTQAVDLASTLDLGADVTAYRITRGPRSGGSREDLVLLWRAAGPAGVDLSGVLGQSVRVMDAVSGAETALLGGPVPVGPDPVLARR